MPYLARCIFCGAHLSTDFFDEVESHIMACRERTLPEKRGDLSAFPRAGTKPLTCEEEAVRKQAERSGRVGGSGGGP